MRCAVLGCCIIMILLNATACTVWKSQSGVVILPEVYPSASQNTGLTPDADVKASPARKTAASGRNSFTLPDGWHWQLIVGDDFIATKDGVFLQNIYIERINVYQTEPSDWMHSIISRLWPLRTVKYLKKPFASGMAPTDSADVVLASRANNPGVSDLEIREVITQTITGYQGFKAIYDFRLDVQGRKTPYRTLYYGFMRDDWFYGISYTAARRYYFEKDAKTFEAVLQSFRLVEK